MTSLVQKHSGVVIMHAFVSRMFRMEFLMGGKPIDASLIEYVFSVPTEAKKEVQLPSANGGSFLHSDK